MVKTSQAEKFFHRVNVMQRSDLAKMGNNRLSLAVTG
jgi:hypothetical protein